MTENSKPNSNNSAPTRFWEKISLVAEISSRCRAAAPTRETFVELLEMIQTIVPFDAATLYLLDSGGQHLAEKATLGSRVDVLSFLKLDSDGPLNGWTARNKRPILVTDQTVQKDFEPDIEYATIMSVPLLVENEVFGVLNLGCYQPAALEEKHVKLMTIVADQLAVSIERLAYEDMIEAKNEALEKAHLRLKDAQAKIIASEKLASVAELSVSINHEINNPLAVIIGNIQCLLAQQPPNDPRTVSRLKRIEAAAIKVSEINRKLLKIDSLVIEKYVEHDSAMMINLDKSISK